MYIQVVFDTDPIETLKQQLQQLIENRFDQSTSSFIGLKSQLK